MDLRKTLILDEGRVAHAYTDSEGYLTIGIGHLIDKRKGGALPDHIIDALFDWDIQVVTKQLDEAFPWFRQMNEPRQEVLINMCFQMGLRGLSKFRSSLGAMRDEHYADAAEHMRRSLWAKQTRSRCYRLALQMELGERQ